MFSYCVRRHRLQDFNWSIPAVHRFGSTVKQDLFVATIYHLDKPKAVDFRLSLGASCSRILTNAGISVLASFVTENASEYFPRLPVREDANVFVWFSRFPDREAYERSAAAVTEAMREGEVTTKLAVFTREPPRCYCFRRLRDPSCDYLHDCRTNRAVA